MKLWLRLFVLAFTLITIPAVAQVLGGPVIEGPGGNSSISLTTSGTSGAATLSGSVLNIPVYAGGATALSALISATTTNSIDNTLNAQTWIWSTATTQNPLSLTATALTTGSLLTLTTTAGATALTVTGNASLSGTTTIGTLQVTGNASLAGTTTISTPLLGLGSLTTSATTGFAYMPTSAGAPIGTPTSKSGYVPFEYDTTDNRFYIYSAGWSNIGISLSSLVGASSTNTFDNAALAQAWTWNTITTQTALSLSSTTITTGSLLTLTATAGTTGSTLNVTGNAAISGTTTLSTASVTDAFGANSSLSVSTTTITPNLTGGQNFIAQLTTACVCGIANPTNIASVVGQTGVIAVIQPASATTTVTWGSDYDFPDGTSPTLSTTTGAQDGFSYWVKDSTHIWVASGGLAFAP